MDFSYFPSIKRRDAYPAPRQPVCFYPVLVRLRLASLGTSAVYLNFGSGQEGLACLQQPMTDNSEEWDVVSRVHQNVAPPHRRTISSVRK